MPVLRSSSAPASSRDPKRGGDRYQESVYHLGRGAKMNPKLYGVIYRSAGKIIKGIRRLGIDILPLTRGNGGFAGMRVQWKDDEPNALRGTVVATTVDSKTVR